MSFGAVCIGGPMEGREYFLSDGQAFMTFAEWPADGSGPVDHRYWTTPLDFRTPEGLRRRMVLVHEDMLRDDLDPTARQVYIQAALVVVLLRQFFSQGEKVRS